MLDPEASTRFRGNSSENHASATATGCPEWWRVDGVHLTIAVCCLSVHSRFPGLTLVLY